MAHVSSSDSAEAEVSNAPRRSSSAVSSHRIYTTQRATLPTSTAESFQLTRHNNAARETTETGAEVPCYLAGFRNWNMCRSGLCRAIVSFTASVPFIFLVAYTASWYVRLDPVFTPLQCKEKGDPAKDSKYDFWPIPGSVHVHEKTTYQCHNTNPYHLEIRGGSGSFLLWSTMTEIGQVEIPPWSVERDGEGEMILDCKINLEGFNNARETLKLLEGPQDVIQNMTIVTLTKIPFLFFELTQVKTMHQICGKKINILTQQATALNCADSLAELTIYDFDVDATLFTVKTTHQVEAESSRMRDLATAGIMTVSIAASLALLLCGIIATWRAFQEKAAPAKSAQPSSTVEEPVETDIVDGESA